MCRFMEMSLSCAHVCAYEVSWVCEYMCNVFFYWPLPYLFKIKSLTELETHCFYFIIWQRVPEVCLSSCPSAEVMWVFEPWSPCFGSKGPMFSLLPKAPSKSPHSICPLHTGTCQISNFLNFSTYWLFSSTWLKKNWRQMGKNPISQVWELGKKNSCEKHRECCRKFSWIPSY